MFARAPFVFFNSVGKQHGRRIAEGVFTTANIAAQAMIQSYGSKQTPSGNQTVKTNFPTGTLKR
jgi:hypothetical protein